MATYASYKTLTADNFQDNSITAVKLGAQAGNKYNVKYIYNERGMRCHHCADAGDCCEQANGKCCYWTVPADVSKVTFEIWSGGGGGAGSTCCNYCMHSAGGSGGNYALAAAKVLAETDMSAEDIARKSIKVASDICVFTNNNINI